MRKKLFLTVLIVLVCSLIISMLFACDNKTDTESGSSSGSQESSTIENVSRIAVTGLKLTYNLGEKLDLTEYTVKVILRDGTTKEIPMTDPYVKVEGFNPYYVGEMTFTVRYGQASTDYTVTIVAPPISKLELLTLPAKLEYTEGDDFSITGCTARMTLTSGNTVDIEVGQSFVSGFRSDLIGKQTITVTYSGLSTTFEITVKAKTLKTVKVGTKPSKTEYIVGDEFQSSGLTLIFTYSNGSQEERALSDLSPSEYKITYSFVESSQNSPVKITYIDTSSDKTEYEMTVYCVVSSKIPLGQNGLKIIDQPTQIVDRKLVEGGVIDYTGGLIRITYQDNTTQDFPMSSPVLVKKIYDKEGTLVEGVEKAGTYKIRFSYQNNDSRGWYVEMNIEVIEKTAESIKLVNTEKLLSAKYYLGLDKEVNYNDLKYVIIYNNGTESDPVSVEKTMLENSDFSTKTVDGEFIVEGEDRYKEKVITVKDAKSELTDSVTVKVYEQKVTTLTVLTPPDNIFLDALSTSIRSLTGMTFRAVYNSGYEEDIDATGVTATFIDGSTDPSQYVQMTDTEHATVGTLDGNPVAKLYKLTLTYGKIVDGTYTYQGKTTSYDVAFTTVTASDFTTITRPASSYIKGDRISVKGQEFSVVLNGETKTLKVTKESDTDDTVTFQYDTVEVTLKKSVYLDKITAEKSGDVQYNFFGATSSQSLIVTPLQVSAIEVVSDGSAKVDYEAGEDFSSPDGIQIDVIFNNKSRASYTPHFTRVESKADILTTGFYYTFSDSTTTDGEKTVSLYYRYNSQIVSTTWKINYHKENRILTSIELYKGTEKTTTLGKVAAGLSVNLQDYKLKLTYSFSTISETSYIDLTQNMIDYDYQDETVEKGRVVTITYSGLTTTATLEVVTASLDHIDVDTSLMTLDYTVGEPLDYANGYIIRYYQSSSGLAQDRINLSYGKLTGFDSDITFTEGSLNLVRTITVEYAGCTATFNVTIWNKQKPSITFINTRQSVDTTFSDNKTFTFNRPTDAFEDPEYKIYFEFQDATGNWIDIASNGSYYEYVVDGMRREYYTRDLYPHHVGTYRMKVVFSATDFYDSDIQYSTYEIVPTTTTIRINSKSKLYGEENGEFTFTPSDQKQWDYVVNTLGVEYVGAPALTSEIEDVGTYSDAIGIGTLTHPYFNITAENGTFVINPKSLTVTLENADELRYDGGADLYSKIKLSVSYNGTTLKEGTITELTDYFTVETLSLAEIGTYTLKVDSVKGSNGNSSYLLNGSADNFTLEVEVKKAIRVLEVNTSMVTVTKDTANRYNISVDLTGLTDIDHIYWAVGYADESNFQKVTENSSVTKDIMDTTEFVYIYFKYVYGEEEKYSTTAPVFLRVDLPTE